MLLHFFQGSSNLLGPGKGPGIQLILKIRFGALGIAAWGGNRIVGEFMYRHIWRVVARCNFEPPL